MADEGFLQGPSQTLMQQQLKGNVGMIEDDSQTGTEFTENRGKTVWEDGLIAHGLRDAPPPTGSEVCDEQVLKAFLDRGEREAKMREVRAAVDDKVSDDDFSDDDDEFLREYRAKRLEQLRKQVEKSKAKQRSAAAGTDDKSLQQLETIVPPDFKAKAVDASFALPVIMLIFRGSKECAVLQRLLAPLASRFEGKVKFIQMEASPMISNLPREDCPIVMVYRNGKVTGQFVKLKSFAGPKTTTDIVEWDLARLGVLQTKLTEDPRPSFRIKKTNRGRTARARADDGDEDD